LQVKEGFLGLAIQHADGNDVIPFVSQTEDLEYRLASSIRSLTRTKKPVVGIVNEVKQPEAGMQALREQLTKGYEVRGVSLGDSNQVAGEISLLILAGSPDSLPTAQLDRLNRFFDRGGSALVLASGMELSPQMPMAMPKPVGWNSALQRFGVSVRSDMVYDLQAAEIVPVPSEAGRVLRLYPFFIRGGSTGKSVINKEVGEAVFTWASSIDTTGKVPRNITPLFTTSRTGGVSSGETMIDPNRDFPQTDLNVRLLAVQAEAKKAPKGRGSAGRVVVIGDATFASDRSARGSPENLAVAANAVDWLAQDEALISIRAKDRRPPPLVFTSNLAREGVKYVNVIGIPLLVAAAGLVRLARRRRRTREPYRPFLPVEPRAA